jgi:CPA2 family monovalent cation:H+ antiporter-2
MEYIMQVIEFIQDLAVIMLSAGLATVIFYRLKQPVVLGYILTGFIIGPYTPPFSLIQNQEIINILAELGIVFLMFSLGLEFNLKNLRKVGLAAFVAAIIEIIVMAWIGYEIGCLFGWTSIDSIFLGGILAISSTTIIIKALSELKLQNEKYVQLIFGILIIEDILGIAILAFLSGVVTKGSIEISNLFFVLQKLAVFIFITIVLGIALVPKILAYVAKFKSNEMLLITVLGLCFGFCLLVIKLNYSIALGAFIIGAIIAEAKEYKTIEELVKPLRDMFSAIFFVSVGLLLDPKILIHYTTPILVITAAVVIGKIISCAFGTFLTGKGGRTSLQVGMGLAQIGEFSFIIAAMGISLQVTSQFLYPIAVAVSVITTFLTPYLIRYSYPLSKQLGAIIPTAVAKFFYRYTNYINQFQDKMRQYIYRKKIR